MSKLLLTGARGFTGRHFAKAAQLAGYEVHPLSADLTDAKAVAAETAAAAPDFVVHLAAISAVTHADEEALYRVNLFGTLNLLKALAALPQAPKRVLLASSANVYGNVDTSPIDESTCPAPVNHYAMSKLAMEFMSATFAERLPLVTVRPFNYTGIGHDTRFVIPKLVAHFVRRADTIELGNLDVEREFNDVRTVCTAYLRLLQLGQPGQTYNVCSGRPVSLKSAIEALKEITGHDLAVKVNPDFIRANEVHRLCGNPAKLEACIGQLQHPPLEDTLSWMLSAGA
ncbi:GDP-mannose 4,6-dehydratase [Methylobacter svalbardensis]|uniref:GDP-mannose 4,6-dehydratase n=1 Tax=Methylobacter svalbardensis TaxID=3080016 RepID=UPI0030EB86A8